MTGAIWSNLEEAIVVYFASHGVQHETCKKLLNQRQGDGQIRSTVAIGDKLRKIRQAKPALTTSNGDWDLQEVEAWIKQLELSDLDIEKARLTMDMATVKFIQKVSLRAGLQDLCDSHHACRHSQTL